MTAADGNNVRFGFINASFMKHENYSVNLFKRENFLGRSGEIYHYTSIGGFKGIIESGGFWASDNRFLNDSEEMNHGINLVVHVIRHRLRRTKIPAFCHILERTCDSIARPNCASSLVACFSKERDDLGQWRGYAGPGGLCIKLREPRKDERPVFYFPHQAPLVVKYQNRSKAVSILSIINRFEREYMADQAAMPMQWPYLHTNTTPNF